MSSFSDIFSCSAGQVSLRWPQWHVRSCPKGGSTRRCSKRLPCRCAVLAIQALITDGSLQHGEVEEEEATDTEESDDAEDYGEEEWWTWDEGGTGCDAEAGGVAAWH